MRRISLILKYDYNVNVGYLNNNNITKINNNNNYYHYNHAKNTI